MLRRDHFEPIPSHVTNRRTLHAWRKFDDRRVAFYRLDHSSRLAARYFRQIFDRYRKASDEFFKRNSYPSGVLRPPKRDRDAAVPP